MDKGLRTVGLYSSVITVLLTILTFGIAFFTPPLGGPWCVAENCYTYPYLDIAERFPRDYYWMFPAMILMLSYLVLISAIHQYAPENKKVFTQIGFSLGLASAIILISNYFLQVSIIQPSIMNGEFDGISILTQFNPHGIFIVLEELGYILMSLGFLFLAPAFVGGGLTKWIRWILVSSFTLIVASFIYASIRYGINREYIFEIASISINWLTLIISGTLLAVFFKNQQK